MVKYTVSYCISYKIERKQENRSFFNRNGGRELFGDWRSHSVTDGAIRWLTVLHPCPSHGQLGIMVLQLGWIRNFAIRNFTQNYFCTSKNCHIISRNNMKKSQHFAKNGPFGGLDPGHAPNQIGQDSKGQENTRDHAKIGQLLRTTSSMSRFKSNRKHKKGLHISGCRQN
jgi:hypothetical protein